MDKEPIELVRILQNILIEQIRMRESINSIHQVMMQFQSLIDDEMGKEG